MRELVQSEVDEIAAMRGFLTGDVEGLPENYGVMPQIIWEGLEAETREMFGIHERCELAKEDLVQMTLGIVQFAVVTGVSLGKLEAAVGGETLAHYVPMVGA